jgi:uncharacterized protein (TIGR03000 family)
MEKAIAMIRILAVICCVLIGSAATAQSNRQQATGEIVLLVPGTADIFFNGKLTTEKGTDAVTTCHSYITPPLGLGHKASYEVRARWEDRGKVVEQTRKVEVTGGNCVSVSLMIPLPTQLGPPGQPARISKSSAAVAGTNKLASPSPRGSARQDTVETRFGTLTVSDRVPDQASTDAAEAGPARGAAGGSDYWAITTAAARELSQQLGFLQQSFATISGPPQGRGLYGQADGVQLDLIGFQQKLGEKASREVLYITFAQVDAKVTQLLGDIQSFTTWDAAVRMAARRVSAAQHDLQFALSAGDGAPTRQSQVAYRQTLLLLSRTEDLEGLVRFMFAEQQVLKGWNADFADLRSAISALQSAQQNKASRDDIKKRLLQTDQA